MGQKGELGEGAVFRSPLSAPLVEVDYLVCGQCQRDFPLANIVSFMQHKKFDCDDFRDCLGSKGRVLVCQSCPRKFNTPWRLLQHAQSVHNLCIYFEHFHPPMQLISGNKIDAVLTEETDTKTPERHITSENSNQDIESFDSTFNESHHVSKVVREQNISSEVLVKKDDINLQSNIDFVAPGNMSTRNIEITTDSNIDSYQVKSESKKDTNNVNLKDNQNVLYQVSGEKNIIDKEGKKSQCDEECDVTLNNVTQANKTAKKINSNNTRSLKKQSSSNKLSKNFETTAAIAEKDDVCCDNQDCGITVMPGTHEELKKCCNAVIPKKRKRHMETKHMFSSGRNRRRSSSLSDKYRKSTAVNLRTVVIDIDGDSENDSNNHTSAAEKNHKQNTKVNNISSKTTIDINSNEHSNGEEIMNSNDRSLIIQPGSMLSIPVISNTSPISTYFNYQNISSKNTSSMVNSGQKVGDKPIEYQNLLDLDVNSRSQNIELNQLDDFGNSTLFSGGNLSIHVSSSNINEQNRTSSNMFRNFISPAVSGGSKGPLSFRKRKYPTSRPFKCDQCQQAFNQRIHLKKHLSKHTGVKPFQCEQCDYSTVEKSHLKVHIRVHTGEKPFKCTYCEYATSQNSTLKIHLRRHHQGTDGFRCLQCKKEFTEPDCLTTHTKTEHPTKKIVTFLPETITSGGNEATMTGAGMLTSEEHQSALNTVEILTSENKLSALNTVEILTSENQQPTTLNTVEILPINSNLLANNIAKIEDYDSNNQEFSNLNILYAGHDNGNVVTDINIADFVDHIETISNE